MKRILSIIMALSLLAVFLTSCAGEGNPAETTPHSNNTDSSTAETDELSPYEQAMKNLTTGSYGGYEFRVGVVDHGSWAEFDMAVEDQMGGQVNDAIYYRNITVEEKLGIKITQQIITDYNIITVMAQVPSEDNFDAMWIPCSRTGPYISSGVLLDLASVDTLDLENPWWKSKFNDSISIGNHIYSAAGDLNMVYYSAFGVCAFNYDLLNDLDQSANLFEVYNSGDWTWEKMFDYMALAADDLNGDGQMRATDDRFGLGMHYNALKSFLSSSGFTIVQKDSNGYPVYNGVSEKFGDAYTKVIEKVANPQTSVIPGGITEGYGTSATGNYYDDTFIEGRQLFYIESSGALKRIKNGDVNFGIIGYPKYDENSDYHSPIYYGLSALSVLSSNSNLERTGTVLENLGAYSYDKLTTAYVQNVLCYRYANDPESVNTLMNAFDTGICDLAYIYNWASMLERIQDAQRAGNTNYVSLFKKAEKSLTTAISNFNKSLGAE